MRGEDGDLSPDVEGHSFDVSEDDAQDEEEAAVALMELSEGDDADEQDFDRRRLTGR